MTANDFEDELDAIRVELYEERKHLSNAEIVRLSNANARRIADKYGLVVEPAATGNLLEEVPQERL